MSTTERPWHVDGVFIVNEGDLIVTTMTHEARSNADRELIVRAVNAFDDLVAALREVVQACEQYPDRDEFLVRRGLDAWIVRAHEALRDAGVKSG